MNDIVVYSQKKKIPHTVLQPYQSPKSDLDEVARQLEEPKAEVMQLTDPRRGDSLARAVRGHSPLNDKDGLDRSYVADDDFINHRQYSLHRRNAYD